MFLKKDVKTWINFFDELNKILNCYGHSILWQEDITPIIKQVFLNLTDNLEEIKYIIDKIRNNYTYDNLIKKIYEMTQYRHVDFICMLSDDIKSIPVINNKFYLPYGIDVFVNEKGEAEFLSDVAFLGTNEEGTTLYLKAFYFSYEWFLNVKNDFARIKIKK